jgi:aspartate/methionine/tyrosine aminotransferase
MIIPTGMRAVIDAMNMYNSELCSGVSVPIQYATIKGFEDTPEMNAYMSNSRDILRVVSNIFRRTLDEAGFAITNIGPLGSYYILMDFTN